MQALRPGHSSLTPNALRCADWRPAGHAGRPGFVPPRTTALFAFGKKATPVVEKPTEKRESFFALFSKKPEAAPAKSDSVDRTSKMNTFAGAMDFSAYRTKDEANLMYNLMYDENGKKKAMAKGQKLTPEQYRAVRRKVGGTYKDYFKGWVDVKGKYTDKGYVAEEASITASAVPGVPVLVATLLGVLAVLVAVVSRT